MGSPVGPIVANLFMEWFEEQALATFRAELQLWKRYVDDTGVAIEEVLLEEFSTYFNSIHPDIKFTREKEDDEKCLPMLDVKTQRGDDGRLSFTVYRKPSHTDQLNTSSSTATSPSNTNLELFAPSTIGRKSSVQPKRRK